MKIIYSISRDNLVQWLMRKFVIIQSKNSFKVNKNWNNALNIKSNIKTNQYNKLIFDDKYISIVNFKNNII